MNSRNQAGITWLEALIVLSIIAILASLAVPSVTCGPVKGGGLMTQSLNNLRQLQLATQSMAIDGAASADTNRGWPGDTGGSFTNWTAQLVKGGYLQTNDLCKLLSGPGIVLPRDQIPTSNNTAVLVYAVSSGSPSNTVFVSSANFTNTPAGGEKLSASAKPFGNKGFVVFRKGGDGNKCRASQLGNTNAIGSFAPLCR